ncbi:succinate dehydrogenase/fumarate reductase iron-sulfur subunit [Caloramator mitchellensis]|uniref:Succinate dehydrogenase/fumarate reductase iron-sulfur subunit n=1 Tax=Caloramator mitchellensis TaxID=908809 RepID=A0A0R3JQS3_CALMK|nr:(Fe-S)-binding protein [Caloramator mitchellensis]KRQ85795.1 succinate dehydrogenase/fumarate reductase iron-sulfur subunit [Caloramator mitchellensis]
MKHRINSKVLEVINDFYCKCLGCNQCTDECVFLKKHIVDAKSFLFNLLNSEEINNKIPYYCFGCNACQKVCPAGINFGELFLILKKDISNYKRSPHIKHFVIHNHQKFGNSNIFSLVKGNSNVAFMPGCSLSSYSPELVEKIYMFLRSKLNEISIILKCCGNPSLSLGEEEKFKSMYNELINSIEQSKIDHIITACQSCYKTLKNNSPNLKVTSLWELLSGIDMPKLNINETFFIWDSCSAEDSIMRSIRNLAGKLGIKIENDEISYHPKCCGLGGCVHTINRELFAENVNINSSKIKTSNVLTYCAGCRDALSNTKNAFHILDLIFYKDLIFKKPNGTIKAWSNRYRLKRFMEDIHEES